MPAVQIQGFDNGRYPPIGAFWHGVISATHDSLQDVSLKGIRQRSPALFAKIESVPPRLFFHHFRLFDIVDRCIKTYVSDRGKRMQSLQGHLACGPAELRVVFADQEKRSRR